MDVEGSKIKWAYMLTGCYRGQYSDAVLNELESQNDGQVEGIMGKVRQLKDVCFSRFSSVHIFRLRLSR